MTDKCLGTTRSFKETKKKYFKKYFKKSADSLTFYAHFRLRQLQLCALPGPVLLVVVVIVVIFVVVVLASGVVMIVVVVTVVIMTVIIMTVVIMTVVIMTVAVVVVALSGHRRQERQEKGEHPEEVHFRFCQFQACLQ